MSTIEPPEGFRTSGTTPRGTRIVLVRHGEAHCNVRGIVGGPIGCGGLTDLGEHQARALRDRLLTSREFDDAVALYTSVLPRAVQTAEIIAPGLPSHLRAQRDCALCELHPGEGDGMTWDELINTFGGPDWDKDPHQPFAPGGESWMDFYERCEQALATLVQRHPGERVILVVHGGVIEQAMKILERKDPMVRLKLRTEHCSLTEIEFDGDVRRLLRYNDRAPLAAE